MAEILFTVLKNSLKSNLCVGMAEEWTSLNAISSVTETECAHCLVEEHGCWQGPSSVVWDQSSRDLLPRGHRSTRRPRTGGSLYPRMLLVSAEVRSLLASLRCSSRALSVGKLATQDAAGLTTLASDLEGELARLLDRVRSTSLNLRRRADRLRRRLRFHGVTALGGVRRVFDGGLADQFGEVRDRSLAPLVADCYQTMSDVERTVKQLTFTSASEIVARQVNTV